MKKINVLKCCRCGSVPKATKHGEWYRIFCPKCHIGRSKHACNDLNIVAWEWNNRAKRENMKIDCQYPREYVEVEIVDERQNCMGDGGSIIAVELPLSIVELFGGSEQV